MLVQSCAVIFTLTVIT